MQIMIEMMMETLGELGTDEDALRASAEDYVARLTGKDTIYQMVAFAEHVQSLGGDALTPEEYKSEFLRRLGRVRASRLAAIQSGSVDVDSMMVPGSRALLDSLRECGLDLVLASGTDHEEVCREAKLLGIAHYFNGGIHGAVLNGLTKRALLRRIVASGISGEQILAFGDGPVEIENTKEVGGIAVGVASDEGECLEIDEKKRMWLARAGADFIIPNYLDPGLLETVMGANVETDAQ